MRHVGSCQRWSTPPAIRCATTVILAHLKPSHRPCIVQCIQCIQCITHSPLRPIAVVDDGDVLPVIKDVVKRKVFHGGWVGQRLHHQQAGEQRAQADQPFDDEIQEGGMVVVLPAVSVGGTCKYSETSCVRAISSVQAWVAACVRPSVRPHYDSSPSHNTMTHHHHTTP